MTNSRFSKGSGCYTCQSCQKTTRNTEDEAASRLCADCYNLAGLDNYLTDEGVESFLSNYEDEARRVMARRPELVSCFPDISQVLGI